MSPVPLLSLSQLQYAALKSAGYKDTSCLTELHKCFVVYVLTLGAPPHVHARKHKHTHTHTPPLHPLSHQMRKAPCQDAPISAGGSAPPLCSLQSQTQDSLKQAVNWCRGHMTSKRLHCYQCIHIYTYLYLSIHILCCIQLKHFLQVHMYIHIYPCDPSYHCRVRTNKDECSY